MDMKTIDRLQEYMRAKGINDNQITVNAKLSIGQIGKAKKEGKALNSDSIEKILYAYPDLNGDWLLTGNGAMLRSDNETTSEKPSIQIPLIPIDAVAGFNGVDIDCIRMIDCEQYAIPEFVAAKAEFLIRVSGSSMYPKYSNGDILACRRIQEVTFIQWGKVYVIDSSQGAMVKRMFEIEGDQDNVLCKSDNANYPPFKLPKTDIRSLSIVVGVVRLE